MTSYKKAFLERMDGYRTTKEIFEDILTDSSSHTPEEINPPSFQALVEEIVPFLETLCSPLLILQREPSTPLF